MTGKKSIHACGRRRNAKGGLREGGGGTKRVLNYLVFSNRGRKKAGERGK